VSLSFVLHHVHGTFVAGTHPVLPVARVHAIDSFAGSGGDVNGVRATKLAERSVDSGIWDSIFTEQVVEIRCDGVSAVCSSKHWHIDHSALVKILFEHLLGVLSHLFFHDLDLFILAQVGLRVGEQVPAFLEFALEKKAN